MSTAQANAASVLTGNAAFEIPVIDTALIAGALRSAGSVAGRVPIIAAGLAGAAAYDSVMRPVAEFQSRHLGLDEDFDEILANPLISQGLRDKMLGEMLSDPLFASASKPQQKLEIYRARGRQAARRRRHSQLRFFPFLGQAHRSRCYQQLLRY